MYILCLLNQILKDKYIDHWHESTIQVWKYNEGEITHVGLGHTSPITRLRISPDQKSIVTVSEDGAIYIWEMPIITGTS